MSASRTIWAPVAFEDSSGSRWACRVEFRFPATTAEALEFSTAFKEYDAIAAEGVLSATYERATAMFRDFAVGWRGMRNDAGETVTFTPETVEAAVADWRFTVAALSAFFTAATKKARKLSRGVRRRRGR